MQHAQPGRFGIDPGLGVASQGYQLPLGRTPFLKPSSNSTFVIAIITGSATSPRWNKIMVKDNSIKPHNLRNDTSVLFLFNLKSHSVFSFTEVDDVVLKGKNNEVAILAGGFDGGSILNSVEVFSEDGSCNAKLPPLPLAIYGVGLFFMNER